MKGGGNTELAKQLGISRPAHNELRRAGKIRREQKRKVESGQGPVAAQPTFDGQQEIRSRLETAPAAAEGGDVRETRTSLNRARASRRSRSPGEELNLGGARRSPGSGGCERAWTEANIAFATDAPYPDKLAPRLPRRQTSWRFAC